MGLWQSEYGFILITSNIRLRALSNLWKILTVAPSSSQCNHRIHWTESHKSSWKRQQQQLMHLQHLDHANAIHYSIWKIKWHAVFTLQKLSLISLTKWIPLWVIVKVPLGLGVLSSWIKYFWMPSGPGQPPYWAICHPCTKAWLFPIWIIVLQKPRASFEFTVVIFSIS